MRKNKANLVEAIVKRTTIPIQKERVSEILDILMDEIVKTVAAGDEIILADFGRFRRIHKKDRSCLQVSSREPIVIKAFNTPSFAAGKRFKDLVKGER